MNLQAEKIELAKLLLETDDKSLIKEIKALFKSREKDFWDKLPQQVKDGIKRGKEQARNGMVTPHDEIMQKYAKYL